MLSAFESVMVKYSLYTKAKCSLEGVLAHPHLKGGDAYDNIRNNLFNDCFRHVNCRVV